jgi:hypothetical protein
MANVGGPPGICVSAVLASTEKAAGAVGTASLLSPTAFDSQSLDVIVSYLPPPITFGSGLSGYTFTVVNGLGEEVYRQSMTPVASAVGTWAGSLSTTTDNPFPADGIVMVFASTDSLLGPQAAFSDLSVCKTIQ